MKKSSKRGVVMQPPKTTKRRDFNNPTPTGIVLNGKRITKLRDVLMENRQFDNTEFMYLRENELQKFDPYVELPNLKILDLSMNQFSGSITFLPLVPCLRHLYITGNKLTSLEGVSGLQHLETLCASDNEIASFAGLDALPNLRVLSLNFNRITSFELFPHLPSLYSLNLVGNSVASLASYRQMAVALCGTSLRTVDDTYVTDEERAEVLHLRGKVVYCISEGFLIDGENVEEAADMYMLRRQRWLQKGKPLALHSIRMSSSDPSSNVLTEGVPANLSVCMQDVRAYSKRSTDVFTSRYIFPVTFKVMGDASEVFVMGTINGWGEPLPLDRCQEGDDVFFHATLYLPSGNYEYRYIVDGQEKVSEQNKAESKYRQGMCNIYHVTESQQSFDEEQDTILYIRWMRSDENNGFHIIENENALTYTPTLEDVGFCLRAEVLAYVNGDYSLNYFDISSPVVPGAPRCTRLELKGEAVEGQHLDVEADYVGGREGDSSLLWSIIGPNGDEAPLALDDPWAGYTLGLEDVGRKVRVQFTPIRDDWTAGPQVSTTTSVVTAGIPRCLGLRIVGAGQQSQQLVCESEYTGGVEGASRYQWFRHDDGTNEFYPIAGENRAEYSPTLNDVNKVVAVEYTPVSIDGVEGERFRCILDKPITAAPPEIISMAIRGELEEGNVVVVDYEYFGGVLGYSHVQWHRREDARTLKKIGRPNTSTYTLTAADVGHTVEAVLTPVRSDGVEGPSYTAATLGPIRAARPQLKALEISGPPQVGRMLEVRAEYVGGEEGDSIIEWGRSTNDEAQHFDVIARGTTQYIVQAADEGRMLRVAYTPVRRDGAIGDVVARLVHVPGTAAAPNAPGTPNHFDPATMTASVRTPDFTAEPFSSTAAEPSFAELQVDSSSDKGDKSNPASNPASNDALDEIKDCDDDDQDCEDDEPVGEPVDF